jgi:hydroxyacylglutathione hydrolase
MTVGSDTLVVHKIISSIFFENTYIVVNTESGGAILIDPGRSTWQRIKLIIGKDIKIEAIFITHAHFDHVFDLGFVKAETNAPIYMHQLDVPLLKDFVSVAKTYDADSKPLPDVDIFCREGDVIKLGDIVFEVIHVPGHTAGSVCLKWKDGIFTGDTLMFKTIGDCAQDGFDEYIDGIKNKLFTLPENLVIYPGHSKYTTIGEEKLYNQIII